MSDISVNIKEFARVVTQTANEDSPLGCFRRLSLHGWCIGVVINGPSVLVLDHVLIVQSGHGRAGPSAQSTTERENQSCSMTQAREQPTTRETTPRIALQNLGSLG